MVFSTSVIALVIRGGGVGFGGFVVGDGLELSTDDVGLPFGVPIKSPNPLGPAGISTDAGARIVVGNPSLQAGNAWASLVIRLQM